MAHARLVYRVHALERMFQRGISNDDVRAVLAGGEEIERYPQDKPYASRLVLGVARGKPIHVVAADDPVTQETIVITVYEPDPGQWDNTFKRRTS